MDRHVFYHLLPFTPNTWHKSHSRSRICIPGLWSGINLAAQSNSFIPLHWWVRRGHLVTYVQVCVSLELYYSESNSKLPSLTQSAWDIYSWHSSHATRASHSFIFLKLRRAGVQSGKKPHVCALSVNAGIIRILNGKRAATTYCSAPFGWCSYSFQKKHNQILFTDVCK